MDDETTGEVKFLKDVRMENISARMVNELLLKVRTQRNDTLGIFGKSSMHEFFSPLLMNAEMARWSVGHLKPRTAEDFKYMRDMAIKQLEITILHKMELLYRSFVCENSKHFDEPLPLKVFSWSAKEFEQRNEVKNNAWVDVLVKKLSNVCLEMRKIKVDLEECVRLIATLLSSTTTGNFKKNQIFHDELKLLAIEKSVEGELAENTRNLQRLINNWLLNSVARDKEKFHKDYMMEMEKKLMEAHVCDPIKIRYQINYYKTSSVQAELLAEKAYQKYTDEIEKLENAMQRESYTSQCTLNSYYTDTGKYKNRLEDLTNKYNKTFDEYENRNQYLRNTMENTRNQRKFLTEQIERFHEERERLMEQEGEIQRRLVEKALNKPVLTSRRIKKGKKGIKGKK